MESKYEERAYKLYNKLFVKPLTDGNKIHEIELAFEKIAEEVEKQYYIVEIEKRNCIPTLKCNNSLECYKSENCRLDEFIEFANNKNYSKEQVEELHNKYISALHVIKVTLIKLLDKDKYKNDSYLKFLLKECDTSNDNTFKLFNRGEVEELLQKQRELSAEKAAMTGIKYGNDKCISDYIVDKESILNAKLKID